MSTINQIGIPNGKAPSKPSANILPVTIALDAVTGKAFFSTAGGDGSGRYDYNWQTIFVDNSKNGWPLNIVCVGTMLSFDIAPYAQAYLPVSCPEGSFALQFTGSPAAEISIALYDIMLPSIIYNANTGQNLCESIEETIITGGVSQNISLVDSTGSAKSFLIQNPSTATEPLYLKLSNYGQLATVNDFEIPVGAKVSSTSDFGLSSCFNVAAQILGATTGHKFFVFLSF